MSKASSLSWPPPTHCSPHPATALWKKVVLQQNVRAVASMLTQSMLLAALLLFAPNCTFHKFLNVWGTGMKSCAFRYLSSLLSFLSLSHALSPFGVEGKAGGRRGTDALVKGTRRKCSLLLQEMTVKLKTKTTTKNIAMSNSCCCFRRCRTAGAIGEAWVWQQGEFGPAI